MKSTNKIDISPVLELENLYGQKNILLKSLVIIYTKAMEFYESDNFDDLINKLDEVQVIENSINLTEKHISVIYSAFDEKNELFQLIKGTVETVSGYPCYKNLSDHVTTSKKLMKNCQVLNEKLTYNIKNAKDELHQKIKTVKNRKIIKEGYDPYSPAKSGMTVYC